MAELFVCCPDQPDQVHPLTSKPVTIGRGEDCTAFIVEKKASRKHLSVRVDRQGRIVAEDLDSSNGTWFVEPEGEDQRILRRLLDVGDTLRIGETTLAVRAATSEADDGSAPLVSGALVSGALVSGGLLSGSLQLTPTGATPAEASAESASADQPAQARRTPSVETTSRAAPTTDGQPRTAGLDRTAFVRALCFCGVAILAIVGVEIGLGGQAGKESGRKDAHLEALRVLESVGDGTKAFKEKRDEFAARFPNSPKLGTLDRHLEKVGEREAFEQRKRDEVNILLGHLDQIPRSEARFRLLQLRRELPGNEEFNRKVAGGIAQLDRMRREEDLSDYQAFEPVVKRLIAQKRLAQADRLLRSFDDNHDAMDAGVKDHIRALRKQVSTALKATSGELWKQVGAEQDPSKRRALLAAAWPALAGTKDGQRIGDRLRSAASLAAPRSTHPGSARPGGGVPPGATPWEPGKTPGAKPTPRVPTVTDQLLARARAAEELLAARRWAEGRAALATLVDETDGGRLVAEWKQRLIEVDGVLGLVADLGVATQGERKPRRKLSTGTWSVETADSTAIALSHKRKGTATHRWSALEPADVLVLLTPARPNVSQRHAVAVLAANLGDSKAFVAALLPVYEEGQVSRTTHALVARHLYGLPKAPEGGYAAYKGELLDAQGVHRRQQQERIAFLRTEADRTLALVAKDPAFKRLGKLQAMRDELDKRRRHALTAIFNTVHYPYPYAKNGRYYAVQGEIDKRVKHAKEIWDDPYSVKIKRDGKLGKYLATWDAAIQELGIKEVDTTDLVKKMASYARYVTGEAINIRTYYRSDAEKEWFAYNHWVMTQYNPARTEVATVSERRQVQVTNEYRMLLGYTATVTPGSAPYESITKDNVVTVLNQAVLEKTMPLRAVRIDNRLVMAARLHSEDMSKRGYFAHQAPPNPATGEGATGPGHRIGKQGYRGFGASENIAMSASPDQAHMMWIHSSGHHRNILSGWSDLGSGVGGRNFTQNFGTGGGARPEIQPDTEIRTRGGAGRGGMRPGSGR